MRRKGYVYIICSKNPKHKQRYVYYYFPFIGRWGLWGGRGSGFGFVRVMADFEIGCRQG